MKKLTITIVFLLSATLAWGFDLNAVPMYAGGGAAAGGAALANTADWTLASGLEEADGTIKLRVGGSTVWNANSLDFSTYPQSPWAWGGGGAGVTNTLRNGMLELWDASAAAGGYYQWATPGLALNTGAGFSSYSRVIVSGVSPTANSMLVFMVDDGVKTFNLNAFEDGSTTTTITGYLNLNVVGGQNYDVGPYAVKEVFAVTDENKFNAWVYNSASYTWQKAFTNLAGAATTSNRILIGGASAPGLGRMLFDEFDFVFSTLTTPLSTTSPTSTMASITVGCTIAYLPIEETTGTGGTVTWDYSTDGNVTWTTGKTLAQLRTALIGTAPTQLGLRANHNSNGLGQAMLRLMSGSLCN